MVCKEGQNKGGGVYSLMPDFGPFIQNTGQSEEHVVVNDVSRLG